VTYTGMNFLFFVRRFTLARLMNVVYVTLGRVSGLLLPVLRVILSATCCFLAEVCGGFYLRPCSVQHPISQLSQ